MARVFPILICVKFNMPVLGDCEEEGQDGCVAEF